MKDKTVVGSDGRKFRSIAEKMAIVAGVNKQISTGKTLRAVAKEMGISETLIRKWCRQFEQPLPDLKENRNPKKRSYKRKKAVEIELPSTPVYHRLPTGRMLAVFCTFEDLTAIMGNLQ